MGFFPFSTGLVPSSAFPCSPMSWVCSIGPTGFCSRTVTRSLINALPELILQMARDQAANGARVEEKGAGLHLSPMASEVEIAAALNRLLTEPQFKEAARSIGDAIKADIDRSSLVDEMETIAAASRRAGQQPLRRQLQGTA